MKEKVSKKKELFSGNEKTDDEISAFQQNWLSNTCYFPPLVYIIKGGKGFQGAWEVLEKTWVGNLGRERLIQMSQEPTQSEFL